MPGIHTVGVELLANVEVLVAIDQSLGTRHTELSKLKQEQNKVGL